MSEIKKPEYITHIHNSIPNNFDGLEDGCLICWKNQGKREIDQWLKSLVENEFSEADIKFLLRSKSYENISKSIHEYIRRHLEVSDEG